MPNTTDLLDAGPGHLTSDQRAELRAALVAERARLERFMPAEEEVVDGVLADAQYMAVLSALQRLEDGTYGICTRCHAQIPFGRSIVLPESEYCVACGAVR
ncbi:MAG: hypothetical protein JWN79_3507 [Gemmatimonadetes bacterium]|jgi:hypothetical protein|nr:hypothetical protein [Gemmatimonadota bacterium]